ncbi:DUF3343 domain-containing protein [Carboxydothermus hydrogenoformans]|uniref:Putative Se/S carrier protein-like domain-containing protein n=1 Tax=Carboxydothermus hydrogenoformans (strain ATCC BAA-161 / DSM 6008 / Z-2901) TaxID=246194 RepID=Q3AFH7_CARHZ|nr:DUF3343 domain-containing protein [Carboxydothermus hydrogenoformans]ABB13822.1 conserved hypothetical protein [Carboxydothermus hydrogenoformans Z-2901]
MRELVFLTFPSIHHLLQLEDILKEKSFKFQMIPLPREIRSDCGTCLLIEKEATENILTLAQKQGIPVEGVYPVTDEKKIRFYQKLFSLM